MSAKSTKSILIMCLLLTLFLPILACVTSPDPNSVPVKSLQITMDVNHLEEFRAQLRNFADKHSLKFEEAFYNGDHTYFSVFMEADDFHIVLKNRIDSPGEFSCFFFNEASPPVPQKTIDKITNDLEGLVMEIPNVSIAERVNSLRIMIEDSREQEVLDQLKKFADKHSLDFKLSFSSDRSLFYLVIYGDGFHIIGGEGLKDNFYAIFYIDSNNETSNPTPFPQESFDELFNDLKNFLEEIPNVTVTEEG
jgi:hypothetical protein